MYQAGTLSGNPLAVAAERIAQAEFIAEVALQEKADAVAHGSTGAGNDQVRFDIAWAVLAPQLEIVAPDIKQAEDWRVATSMRRKNAANYGFGTYEAADYAELIDHPVEVSVPEAREVDLRADKGVVPPDGHRIAFDQLHESMSDGLVEISAGRARYQHLMERTG